MARTKFLTSAALAAVLVGSVQARAITVEQMNSNRGHGPLMRSTEVRSINEDARTVEVAFSSETPVERWFGTEILDHSPGAMIMDRLHNGAAVLWNHDRDLQIGVVENARVDGDRVGRATLRFGNSARAQEIWEDVKSGVIRHISFSYSIKRIRTEEKDGEPDEVRILEYEPFEISFVSVPADPSVGVDRGLGQPPEADPEQTENTATIENASPTEGTGRMKTVTIRNARGDLVRAKVDDDGNIVEELEVLERAEDNPLAQTRAAGAGAGAGADTMSGGGEGNGEDAGVAERARAAEILDLGREYDAADLAATAVREGTDVAAFQRTLLAHVGGNGDDTVAGGAAGGFTPARAAAPQQSRALDDNAGEIGMSQRDVERYSFTRALNALANPTSARAQEAAAFEIECSQAAEDSMGRAAQGIMVPLDVLQAPGARALNTGGIAGPGDTGGNLVATNLLAGNFIEMLRNSSILLAMGTPMGGLVGNIDIPGQSTAANAFWLGAEDDETTETNAETRMISLTPKTVGAFTEITRKMLQQSSRDVEGWMRRELAFAVATAADRAGFYGTGAGGEPLGIANIAGINAVPFGAVNPTYPEIVQMETEVSADNADVGSLRYIGNSKFRGHCKTTQKFANTNGMPIWEQGDTVNGTQAAITNAVADGDVFFGAFGQMVVGMWGGLDLTVDPYTHSRRGRIRLVVFQDFDFGYRHIESFCLGRQ